MPVLKWLHNFFRHLEPFPGGRHGYGVVTLDLEVFKEELGQVIAGAYFEWFERTFGGIVVLVTVDVDIGFQFDFFLDTLNLGIEGVKERDIKPDTVPVEVVNHGKCPMVHPGDVVRVRAIR